MNKVRVYFWVDILMLIFFLIVAVSSVVLFTGTTFLGIRNQDLRIVHNYSGLILIVIIIIHFLIHFKWIASVGKAVFNL